MHYEGLIYKETRLGHFPVDPWTTYSHILLLILLIYWGIKIIPRLREHVFLAIVLIPVVLNLAGSFVYHSLRGNVIWVLLDSLPIFLLSIMLSVYYWRKIFANRLSSLAVMLFPFVFMFMVSELFEFTPEEEPNLGYFAIGIPLIFSMVWYLGKTKWHNWHLLAGAIVSILAAISFRMIDKRFSPSFLYMGTHWLWHVFSTVSAHFLLLYIFYDDLRKKGIRRTGQLTVTYQNPNRIPGINGQEEEFQSRSASNS